MGNLTTLLAKVCNDLVHVSLPGHERVGICCLNYSRLDLNVDEYALPARLNLCPDRRKREYLAGRACAAYLLDAAGTVPGWLPGDRDGAPVWPVGHTGSVTHTRDVAAAALLRMHGREYLGIDLENVIAPGLCEEMRLVMTQEEYRYLKRQRVMRFDQAMTVAFSVKESYFKAFYRALNGRFRSKDVSIVDLTVDGRVTLRLNKNSPCPGPDGGLLHAHYLYHGEAVLTVVHHSPAGQRPLNKMTQIRLIDRMLVEFSVRPGVVHFLVREDFLV